MKTTYRDLIDELLPAFQQLAIMQKDGRIMLHDKIAYGLNKNYHALESLLKSYRKKEFEVLKGHVESESKMAMVMLKTVRVGNQQDFDYKKTAVDAIENGEPGQKMTPDFHRDAATKKLEALRDTEVEWTAYKIPEEEIKGVHNFPMEVYHQMSEYEIITTLSISMVSTNQVPPQMTVANGRG